MSILPRRDSALKVLRSWNFRVIFVAIGCVASFRWWSVWPPGGRITLGPTLSDRLWGIAPLLFRSFLALLFAIWAVKLLFEYLLHSRPAEHLTPAAEAVYQPSANRQRIGAQANRITTLFLLALVLSLIIYWAFARVARMFWPTASAGLVPIVHSVVSVGGTIAFVIYAIRRPVPVQAAKQSTGTRKGMNIARSSADSGNVFRFAPGEK